MEPSKKLDDAVLSLPQSIEFAKEIQKFLSGNLILDAERATVLDDILVEIDDEYIEDHIQFSSFPQLIIEQFAKLIADDIRSSNLILGTYFRISRLRDSKKGCTTYRIFYLVSN